MYNLGSHFLQLLPGPGGEHQAGSSFRKSEGDAAADASAGAGYYGDLIAEIEGIAIGSDVAVHHH
jgi:hypothetical protein